jgi:hypothetical protein
MWIRSCRADILDALELAIIILDMAPVDFRVWQGHMSRCHDHNQE